MKNLILTKVLILLVLTVNAQDVVPQGMEIIESGFYSSNNLHKKRRHLEIFKDSYEDGFSNVNEKMFRSRVIVSVLPESAKYDSVREYFTEKYYSVFASRVRINQSMKQLILKIETPEGLEKMPLDTLAAQLSTIGDSLKKLELTSVAIHREIRNIENESFLDGAEWESYPVECKEIPHSNKPEKQPVYKGDPSKKLEKNKIKFKK